MALQKTLMKRLYNLTIKDRSSKFRTGHSSSSGKFSSVVKASFHRHLLTSPEKSSSAADAGLYFRRFLQKREIKQSSTMSFPELFYFPVGEKLREQLNNSGGQRLRLDDLKPPTTVRAPDSADSVGISIGDAKKILRCSQLQKVRSALKQIPMNSISYSELVTICSNVCANHDQGLEFAKMLDEAGIIIILGNVVFLRPDQVAKSMEKIIQSIAIPNDPRKPELEELERQKAFIDKKAVYQVRGELYSGLGFLIVQTFGFMRLTFWELSWDVMEPICFFVTSFYFALAYMFFLRTSKEPTFEGFFQCRFRKKQRKLMELYNFDQKKYNELCEAFYPKYQSSISSTLGFQDSDHGGSSRTIFG